VQVPRRILVAVEPRLLGDALVAVLTEIGLDDVVRFDAEVASGPIDVALVSDGAPAVRADLVLRVPSPDDLAHEGPGDLRPASTRELIALLDRVCPARESRSDRIPTDLGPKEGVR
jgi:hypothetical protein